MICFIDIINTSEHTGATAFVYPIF